MRVHRTRRGASVIAGSITFCVTLCGYPGGVSAQIPPSEPALRGAARDLGDRGVEAFDAGDYGHAADAFHRAYLLIPAPTLAVREARSLVRLGRLVEASEAYVRAERTPLTPSSPAPFREAVLEAQNERTALLPRLGHLLIDAPNFRPGEVDVIFDGKLLNRGLIGVEFPVDPGAHVVRVEREGSLLREGRVSVEEGAHERLTLAPSSADGRHPRDGWRAVGWAGIAAGGGAVAFGIAAALVSGSKRSSLTSLCARDDVCPESARNTLDSFRTWRTASFIAYGIGIPFAFAGGVIVLTRPSKAKGPRPNAVVPVVGPRFVGVTGTF